MKKFATHTMFDLDSVDTEFMTVENVERILEDIMPNSMFTAVEDGEGVSGVALTASARLGIVCFRAGRHVAIDYISSMHTDLVVMDASEIL